MKPFGRNRGTVGGDSNEPAQEEVAPRRAAGNFRTIALIVATALFMQNLDATVLTTALPTLAREFDVAAPVLSFVLTAYLIALAVFIPASSYVADRFGARTVFQLAIAVFMTGSLACGFATSLEMLIVARFMQGVGGAMMLPVGRLLLLRNVEKCDLVSAISWLTMPALIGPIVGPPLGGLVVTYLEWRWIFWINLPVGALGIVLVRLFIPEVRESHRTGFDFAGFALSGVALASLLFGLQLSARSDRFGLTFGLLAGGGVASLAYIAHARKAASPILDLSLLRIATFRLSVVGGTLIRVTQGAIQFLLPMMIQIAFGRTAATSGLITMAMALGAFAMKGVARPLLARLGFRNVLLCVGLLSPLTFGLIGFAQAEWPLAILFAALLVGGFLISLQFTAYNTIAYADVETERMSRATSFYATFQQLTLSVGVCLAATMLAFAMRWHDNVSPDAGDFSTAIWSVTAVSLFAVLSNWRFARDAGVELSGHGRK